MSRPFLHWLFTCQVSCRWGRRKANAADCWWSENLETYGHSQSGPSTIWSPDYIDPPDSKFNLGPDQRSKTDKDTIKTITKMILNSLADHHDDDQQYEDRGVVCGQGKARATNVFPISPYTRTLYRIYTPYTSNSIQPYTPVPSFTHLPNNTTCIQLHKTKYSYTLSYSTIPTQTNLCTNLQCKSTILFFSIPYCIPTYTR